MKRTRHRRTAEPMEPRRRTAEPMEPRVVRLRPKTLDSVYQLALRRGISQGALVRELVERGLREAAPPDADRSAAITA